MKPHHDAPLLALDTGSSVTSIAVGRGDRVLAERTLPLRRSSERLLAAVEEALAEAALGLTDLAGQVVLRGPGSFTGLRVGLATAMGLHQALDWPTAVLSTSRVLAAAAGPATDDAPRLVVAAVDAMRGEWHVRRYDGHRPAHALDDGERMALADLATLPPCRLIGCDLPTDLTDLDDAAATTSWPAHVERIAAPPLARHALAVVDDVDDGCWDVGRLTRPIYFREPAVTVAARPGR